MHLRKDGPPTVSAAIGREADKLLQRFELLNTANRTALLKSALYMIEGQEDAKLSPRDRRKKRLVDGVDRLTELLASDDARCPIKGPLWRDMLEDDLAELARLGITYFGHATANAS